MYVRYDGRRVLGPQVRQLASLRPLPFVHLHGHVHGLRLDVVPVLHAAPQRVPPSAVGNALGELFVGRRRHGRVRFGVNLGEPLERDVVRGLCVPCLPVRAADGVVRVISHQGALVKVQRGGGVDGLAVAHDRRRLRLSFVEAVRQAWIVELIGKVAVEVLGVAVVPPFVFETVGVDRRHEKHPSAVDDGRCFVYEFFGSRVQIPMARSLPSVRDA